MGAVSVLLDAVGRIPAASRRVVEKVEDVRSWWMMERLRLSFVLWSVAGVAISIFFALMPLVGPSLSALIVGSLGVFGAVSCSWIVRWQNQRRTDGRV